MLDRGRQIAIAISCSQKTLPISLALFDRYFARAEPTPFPLAVVPLLFYHAGQLLLDTLIAQRLTDTETRRHGDTETDPTD